MPVETESDSLLKQRSLFQFQSDFARAAVTGAQAIVHGIFSYCYSRPFWLTHSLIQATSLRSMLRTIRTHKCSSGTTFFSARLLIRLTPTRPRVVMRRLTRFFFWDFWGEFLVIFFDEVFFFFFFLHFFLLSFLFFFLLAQCRRLVLSSRGR
jgi:hypothetical protein